MDLVSPCALARWVVRGDRLANDELEYLCDACVQRWACRDRARLITEYTDRAELVVK